jgi:small subunit ribosomal protein S8e
MGVTQHRSKRSSSGGRYIAARKKRLYESGSEPTLTKVSEKRKIKMELVRGAIFKQRLLQADVANVLDQKTGKYSVAKIKTVLENPANRHYVRRNILTKGTIIDTDKGKARITSRPGQEGTVNAVLVQ